MGRLYLFVAIDRTSKFAFTELHEKATRSVAGLLGLLNAIDPLRAVRNLGAAGRNGGVERRFTHVAKRGYGAQNANLRIAQLDQRTALPDQCLLSAEADVRPPRRKSGFDPSTDLRSASAEFRNGSGVANLFPCAAGYCPYLI